MSEMSAINPGFKIVKKKKRIPVKDRLLKEEANVNSRVSQVVRCLRIHLSVQEMKEMGSIPELGRSPGVGTGNPFLYYSLENPMGRRVLRAMVHGFAKSWTRLSDPAHNQRYL